jgi:hypothetical protein
MAQKIVPGGTAARAIVGKSARELATQRMEFGEDVQTVKAALLRQFGAGTDLGELVYLAMLEAQREVADGHTLLDNCPGSWEAYGLQFLMDNVLNRLGAEERES